MINIFAEINGNFIRDNMFFFFQISHSVQKGMSVPSLLQLSSSFIITNLRKNNTSWDTFNNAVSANNSVLRPLQKAIVFKEYHSNSLYQLARDIFVEKLYDIDVGLQDAIDLSQRPMTVGEIRMKLCTEVFHIPVCIAEDLLHYGDAKEKLFFEIIDSLHCDEDYGDW